MKHVLVVDDEAHILEVVEYALTREGFRVTRASDRQTALDLAVRDAPDLVILDVMLPDLDGLEVCKQLKRGSTVPILFLSARGAEIDRILGLELGGDDYLKAMTEELEQRLLYISDVLGRCRAMITPAPLLAAPPRELGSFEGETRDSSRDLRFQVSSHTCCSLR